MNDNAKLREEALKACDDLAHNPHILGELGKQVTATGFAGPTDVPRLVYLVMLTGMLDRPVSLLIKGPSGAGKSFGLNAGLQFIPAEAYERYEGMSEKALVYLPDLDLKHRHLVIGEASGMADGDGRTLLRQLLSEGKVRYATVQSTEGGLVGSELPTLEGPTGLIMTTTAMGLHPEDESRMISLTLRESPDQILAALMAQAAGSSKEQEPLDMKPWYALYEYTKLGTKKVAIPYAAEIAKRMPLTHDRVKRDFPQVLSLIKAHALLHSCSRNQTDDGTVIAEPVDYLAVYHLVNEPLSQGLEVAVPDSIRTVVEGVAQISRKGHAGHISYAKLAEHLHRDISVVSRNVNKAIKAGYLRNENPGQGREANISIGDRKLPNGSVLPKPREVFETEKKALKAA